MAGFSAIDILVIDNRWITQGNKKMGKFTEQALFFRILNPFDQSNSFIHFLNHIYP